MRNDGGRSRLAMVTDDQATARNPVQLWDKHEVVGSNTLGDLGRILS